MQQFLLRIRKELRALPEILIVAYWVAHVAFGMESPWFFLIAISLSVLVMNVLLAARTPFDTAERAIASVLSILAWLGVGWFGRDRASTSDWLLYGIATAISGWRMVGFIRQARALQMPDRQPTGPGT